MENNNNKSSNNSFGLFLLGVLVGAAVVFLLGTKKGKRILKAISEEGKGKLSNLLDKIENSVDLEPASAKTSEGQGMNLEYVEPVSRKNIVEEKPRVRRFFRGISRHVN